MSCISDAQLKFWFQTDLGRKNSAIYNRQGRQLLWLCSPLSRVGHALRPIFMPWLVKIWLVSSWGKFMQHLESCLPDRVLCQLVMFLTVFFHWMYKMKFSCVIRSLLLFMANLFIRFLIEKYVTCQSRKSYFGWHRFRFSPCLMRKRVAKSEAILTLLVYLPTFSEI